MSRAKSDDSRPRALGMQIRLTNVVTGKRSRTPQVLSWITDLVCTRTSCSVARYCRHDVTVHPKLRKLQPGTASKFATHPAPVLITHSDMHVEIYVISLKPLVSRAA